MKRNLSVLLVVALAVAVMYFGGRKLRNYPPSSRLPMANVSGKPAPDFTLKTIDGKTIQLSSLKGKAVVLNFWATWCSPCKVEIPWFIDLQNQYGSQGLEIVGVAVDDADEEVVTKFAKEMNINYTIAIGSDSVADLYGNFQGLPTTFYIGRDGNMVSRIAGLADYSEIEKNIKKALAQSRTTAANKGAQ